jgi:acetylornithine deacetylase
MNPSTLDILQRLVAFDTTSRLSNLALIGWVQDYLAGHGVTSELTPDPSGQKASLFATIGPRDQPGFVLSGHTDVVPVDGQHWTSDPFKLRVADGRAFGRGAVDMKGFLACCLAAVPTMVGARLTRPIHIAFSYDEEIGCVGVRPMLDRLAAGDFGIAPPAAAFIGEPTGMQVIVGHKGKRSLRAVFHGVAGHSSLAPRFVNAVAFGAELVSFVGRQAGRLAAGQRDGLYDVPHSTAHVGLFRGGEALNIVPDRAEMLFEYRVIGADDADQLAAEAMAYARDVIEPAMKAIDPRAQVEIGVYAGFAGLDTAPEAEVVTLAKRLAGRNDHAKVAFGTEAGLFTTIAGIPAVVIGPGSIEVAHQPDEYIALDQLAACDRFIAGLITTAAQP